MRSDEAWVTNTGVPSLHTGDGPYVEYILRNGTRGRRFMNRLNWDIDDSPNDIVKYRILRDAEDATTYPDERIDSVFGVSETLAERGSRYGDFYDNAFISQALETIMRDAPSFRYLTAVQREGLKAILQKIARILNGDPNYADNWHDIQGYAKLVEERLPKESK